MGLSKATQLRICTHEIKTQAESANQVRVQSQGEQGGSSQETEVRRSVSYKCAPIMRASARRSCARLHIEKTLKHVTTQDTLLTSRWSTLYSEVHFVRRPHRGNRRQNQMTAAFEKRIIAAGVVRIHFPRICLLGSKPVQGCTHMT